MTHRQADPDAFPTLDELVKYARRYSTASLRSHAPILSGKVREAYGIVLAERGVALPPVKTKNSPELQAIIAKQSPEFRAALALACRGVSQ